MIKCENRGEEGRKGSDNKTYPSMGGGWNAGTGVRMQSVATKCAKRTSHIIIPAVGRHSLAFQAKR